MDHTCDTERRAAPRQSVDIYINKYVRGRPYLCRATDLSRRGIRLNRVFEPTVAEPYIGLQFQLPDSGEVITCAGRVVEGWNESGTAGVEFLRMSAKNQKMLDSYLAAA